MKTQTIRLKFYLIIIVVMCIASLFGSCKKKETIQPQSQKATHSITLKAWDGYEVNYNIGKGVVVVNYGTTSSIWTYTVDVPIGTTITLLSKTFQSYPTGVSISDSGQQVKFLNAYNQSNVTYTVK
jgi:hypothetical protein